MLPPMHTYRSSVRWLNLAVGRLSIDTGPKDMKKIFNVICNKLLIFTLFLINTSVLNNRDYSSAKVQFGQAEGFRELPPNWASAHMIVGPHLRKDEKLIPIKEAFLISRSHNISEDVQGILGNIVNHARFTFGGPIYLTTTCIMNGPLHHPTLPHGRNGWFTVNTLRYLASNLVPCAYSLRNKALLQL